MSIKIEGAEKYLVLIKNLDTKEIKYIDHLTIPRDIKPRCFKALVHHLIKEMYDNRGLIDFREKTPYKKGMREYKAFFELFSTKTCYIYRMLVIVIFAEKF